MRIFRRQRVKYGEIRPMNVSVTPFKDIFVQIPMRNIKKTRERTRRPDSSCLEKVTIYFLNTIPHRKDSM
jgi:hypothetical protein